MKSAHEIAVERSDDEMIQVGAETELGTYYRLGNKITVRAGTNHWLCLTCQSSDRWADKERKGCSQGIVAPPRYPRQKNHQPASSRTATRLLHGDRRLCGGYRRYREMSA